MQERNTLVFELAGGRKVRAVRRRNPDQTLGGWVAVDAKVDPSAIVEVDAIVEPGAVVGPGAIVRNGKVALAD